MVEIQALIWGVNNSERLQNIVLLHSFFTGDTTTPCSPSPSTSPDLDQDNLTGIISGVVVAVIVVVLLIIVLIVGMFIVFTMRKRKKGSLKLQINSDTHSNQSTVPVEGLHFANPVYEGNNIK